MRSIIFTSVLAMVAVPGWAADGPQGCFARFYDDAHLARNPQQVIRDISVAFGDFAGDAVQWADVLVTTADQGRVHADGMGGLTFGQIARCSASDAPGGWSCYVECDGGAMHITRINAQELMFRTSYFSMNTGDDCGGNVDLAEVQGQSVTYKLARQPDAACVGRW